MSTWPRPARVLALFLGSLLALAACSKKDEAKTADTKTATDKGGVLLTVNGHPVYNEEVSQMLQILQQQDFVPPDSIAKGVTREEKQRNFAIDRLIERSLILEDARRLKLDPSDADIDAGLPQYMAQNGITDSLPPGITQADIRQGMADDLAIKAYVDSTIMPSIDVNDADIQKFYDENPQLFERLHASHILIRLDPGATDIQKAEARKKAQDVLDQLKKGKDFAELARKHSEDPGSGPNGGDLGSFGRGQMVPTFDEAAFNLAPGNISGIVESQFGYHIIKAHERNKMSLDEIRPRMTDFLMDRKVAHAMEARIKELRATAKIEQKG